MLTTLWIMTVASVVTMAAALVGRNAVSATSARVELERAQWTALACAHRAHAAVDEALRRAPSLDDAAAAWRLMSRRVAGSPLIAECDVSLEAAGTRLDINAATEEQLQNLFIATGAGDRAAELAAALADWRDTNDVAEPLGAERTWYENEHRFPPRNGPLAAVAELRRVRGFESGGPWEGFLGVDAGRVSLATAPVEVLMSIPGITRETAERIAELHDAGTPITDLLSVTAMISEASTSALAARYPEAVRATTADPDAWIIRSRVARGHPEVAVLLEWRIIRTGKRSVVSGTRSFI